MSAPPQVEQLLAESRAAYAAGELRRALAALEQALVLAPRHPLLWGAVAELQHALGEPADALAASERALALAPGHAPFLNQQALALNALGRSAEAEEALRLILARDPHYIAARANLAALLERTNRVEEAERTAREGLRVAPNEPLLNIVVALCALRNRDLETCETFLARVETNPGPGTGPQLVAFLRAKLLHARGDVPRAFAAFEAANALQLADWRRQGGDPERHLAGLRAELAAFAPDQVAGWAPLPPPEPLPFTPAFLVGFPRSGTTLLDQILDSHPAISTIEEQPFVEELLNAVPGGYPAGLAALSVEARAALRSRYAARVRAYRPGAASIVIDKFPLKLTKAGFLQRVFPEARFILALRHPYDVVLSGFMQQFGMNDAMANLTSLERATTLYDLAFALWTRYREQFPLAVQEVRYEALIDDLQGAVEPVLAHLGLPWDERVREFAQHARSRPTRIRTPSYSQVSQEIYTSARGRFLQYLPQFSPAVRARLDPWVARLGYPPVDASSPP